MREDDDWTEADFSDDCATFGDRVTAAREALGLTVAQLARQLGVKTETVQNWEADRSEPRANKLQMLAGILNVPLVWLMAGQGEGVKLAPRRVKGLSREVIDELRAIRADQIRLTERIARLMRQLSD
ncbi:MAG TPA: helix-turn-helix transcriptional regulator [Paracoccaceae bacterium]|nr:helix-turn-helix transcriptional regulator [Paracoccaceae bacterium]